MDLVANLPSQRCCSSSKHVPCKPCIDGRHSRHRLLQVATVSLSAFAYLFSELIQYTVDRATSTSELEER